MIALSFKYALRPNRAQAAQLGKLLYLHRKLYNMALEQRLKAWEDEKRSVSYAEQCRWWSALRKQDAEFALIDYDTGAHTLERLDKAYKRFFADLKAGRKTGKPKFKRYNQWRSFVGRRSFVSLREVNGRMYLRVFGVESLIRVVYHRPIPQDANVKQVRVMREADRWYCVAVVECDEGDVLKEGNANECIGIDVGIEKLLALSDGTFIENPRWFKRIEDKLATVQRLLEKKQKGSKRYWQMMQRVRKLHAKLARSRRTFYHQICAYLTGKFSLIAIEALNIKGLAQGALSKQVNDAAWAMFFEILRWHAYKRGCRIVEVSPNHTSQICSACGRIVKKELSERWHACECGYQAHRDTNAARVILNRAVSENVEQIQSS